MAGGGKEKKLGPNDMCSCGSGKKNKKCCSAAAATGAHTPIQAQAGQVLPGSPQDLLVMATEATRNGNDAKAAHFYTMALDSLAKGMKRDSQGVASDSDLLALNKASNGQLAEMLAGRSHVYLRQGDVAASVEDAETCVRADPAFEKGQLRLMVAYEKAAVPLQRQLEVCEMALEGCPGSELLIRRKWRLKKAIAEQPASNQVPEQEQAHQEPWTIEMTRRIADDPQDHRRALAAADLGMALLTGTHGMSKDLEEAERYLRLGCSGADAAAQRGLGLLLLELERPAEAADALKIAAEVGDEEAAAILQDLAAQANAQMAEARAKLQHMADMGDLRARKMLEDFAA